jgi:hypothetical protein
MQSIGMGIGGSASETEVAAEPQGRVSRQSLDTITDTIAKICDFSKKSQIFNPLCQCHSSIDESLNFAHESLGLIDESLSLASESLSLADESLGFANESLTLTDESLTFP